MYNQNQRLEAVALIIGFIIFGIVNLGIIALTAYVFTLTSSAWSFLILFFMFTLSRKK